MVKKDKKKIKLPKDGSAPDELFTNPDKVFDSLLDDIKEAVDPTGILNEKNNKASDQNKSSEIHISGRIDNFLFGKIKKSYFDELEKSGEVFKDNKKDNQLFLEKFFLLFLENDPFSDKTNLQLFEELIDNKKFLQHCPNFYKIYLTVLPDTHENFEEIRSFEYDHYSFLEEVIDSPSHLSQNTNPEVDNQFRVFSPELFIEVYSEGKKIHESELGKFLELKNIQDQASDEDSKFLSEKQKNVLDKLNLNKYACWNIESWNAVSISKHKSIHYENFWPLDYFKFTMGTSSELLDRKYLWRNYEKHYQYEFKKEVRVTFSNVSKCIFKFPEKIDFEKLSLLRCGKEEICRSEAINYGDDLNLFNFIAYDGKLIKPEETIFRDKGIDLSLTSRNTQYDDNNQPSFFALFID